MAAQAPSAPRVNRLLMLAHRLADWFGLELSVGSGVAAPERVDDAKLMRCIVTMEANEFLKLAEDVLVRADADADVYTCKASVLANVVVRDIVADIGTPVEENVEGQIRAVIRQARKVRRAHDNLVRATLAAERFALGGGGGGKTVLHETTHDFIARSKRLRADVDARLAATRAFLKKRKSAATDA